MRTFADTVSKLFKFGDSGRDTHLQMAETIMGIRGWGGKIVVVGLKGCYPYRTFYSMGLWGPLHTVCVFGHLHFTKNLAVCC